jgi:hypothetical protein
MAIKSLTLSPLVLLLAVSACATAPPASRSVAPNAVAQTGAKKPPLGCVNDTATRLRTPPEECAGMGSSYTSKDLQSTGQAFAQDSLRMLDPAVTGHP